MQGYQRVLTLISVTLYESSSLTDLSYLNPMPFDSEPGSLTD